MNQAEATRETAKQISVQTLADLEHVEAAIRHLRDLKNPHPVLRQCQVGCDCLICGLEEVRTHLMVRVGLLPEREGPA